MLSHPVLQDIDNLIRPRVITGAGLCVKTVIVTLRKRPTSEIRGPQTVGVIGQHNTAHEIPKIDVFISEPQITGILIGTVGAALQT